MKATVLLFGLCSVALLSGCENCSDDCKLLIISLEVADSAGKNLFASPNPVLSFDSVEIIAVHDNFSDNIVAQLQERSGKAVIAFSPGGAGVKMHIVRYSSHEADTITISNYIYDKGKCCSVVRYYDVQLNRQPYCMRCTDEIITVVR